MTRRCSASLSLVLLLSCSLGGCSAVMPRATPETAKGVLQVASRFEKAPGKNLGSSDAYRKPLRSGQWVAMLSTSTSDPNDVTLQVTKVVRVEGDTVTLETESYAATRGGVRAVIQQTMRHFPVKARTAYATAEAADLVRAIEIEKIRMMDESGKVTEMPQLPLGLGRAGAELIQTNVATGDLRTEGCSSTRFKASKCFIVPFETKILWMSESGTTYAHSAIPVLGFLRSESTSRRSEVIGFGDGGAEVLLR